MNHSRHTQIETILQSYAEQYVDAWEGKQELTDWSEVKHVYKEHYDKILHILKQDAYVYGGSYIRICNRIFLSQKGMTISGSNRMTSYPNVVWLNFKTSDDIL